MLYYLVYGSSTDNASIIFFQPVKFGGHYVFIKFDIMTYKQICFE